MSFNISNLLYPLTPSAITLCAVLGMLMGLVLIASHHKPTVDHLFWQAAGGTVFFVPLAFFRGFEGAKEYERLLGTFVLWFVFVGGMALARLIYRSARKEGRDG